ncbi:MAG: hypothetical protein R3A52_13910 [Polyangiales bacterium]
MAMYGSASISPTSSTCTMFGWRSEDAMRASAENIRTKPSFCARWGRTRFTTTSCCPPSVACCLARSTSAIPPQAICRMIS